MLLPAEQSHWPKWLSFIQIMNSQRNLESKAGLGCSAERCIVYLAGITVLGSVLSLLLPQEKEEKNAILVFAFVFVFFLWLRFFLFFQDSCFSVQPWLSWNSLCKPGYPQTQRSTCLCPLGLIKVCTTTTQKKRKIFMYYFSRSSILSSSNCVSFSEERGSVSADSPQ